MRTGFGFAHRHGGIVAKSATAKHEAYFVMHFSVVLYEYEPCRFWKTDLAEAGWVGFNGRRSDRMPM